MKTSLPYLRDSYKDGSALKERHFTTEDALYFYKSFRPKSAVPKEMIQNVNSVKQIDKLFKLKGIQFGNWVTTEDKYNYLALTYLCLKDINKVLKFKDENMGLNGLLAFSFGARGVSSALAHYESNHQVINITRYWRTDKINRIRIALGQAPIRDIPKETRLLKTGGAGSMAHEYGHFLDYSFGRYRDQHKESNWLSGVYRTTKRTVEYSKNHVLRNKMNKVINTALNDKKGNPSAYYKRIAPKNEGQSEYWTRRLEVFARIFEQYISYKLDKMNINNRFLSKTVYKSSVYLKPNEFKSIIKPMDDLIKEMRKHV